jgi:hypothetical protein
VPVSRTNFFDHLRLFRAACRAVRTEAIVSLESWQAFVRQGERHVALHPRFQAFIDGQLQYQPTLTQDSSMFAGWMPYRLKRWETASDKLAFKRYAGSVGVRVPEHWLALKDVPANMGVVVKSPRSSFGMHVHGPFRNAGERPLDLAQGEYYEEYLEGRILKIWFWNAQPVCAEMDRWPAVLGDGARTLEQLTLQRAMRSRTLDDAARQRLLQRCDPLFRYYGRGLRHVLAKGARQVIDFRYGSFLMNMTERTVLDFDGGEPPAWLEQVRRAGRMLHEAIPAEIRAGTVFSVDGILPQDGQVRFLEVNSNPMVHPLVYARMVGDLLPVSLGSDAAAVH